MHGKTQGIDRYVLEVLNHLEIIPSEFSIALLHNSDFPFEYLSYPKRFSFICTKVRGCSLLQQFLVPYMLFVHRIDTYYYPYIDPPILSPARHNVFMIHDMNHFFFSQHAATEKVLAIIASKVFIFLAAIRYEKIITISHYVAGQIAEHVAPSRGKIQVHYHGFSSGRFAAPSTGLVSSRPDAARMKLLYVGNNRPHKNIDGLLKAFKIILTRIPSIQLVIAGNLAERFSNINGVVDQLGIGQAVSMFVSPSDAVLAGLYAESSIFVYPSFSEGFGLPLLEAMHFGLPIACSNTSCLPEIAADAAHYFDPDNPQDMANKLLELLQDVRLRSELVRRGEIRLKCFTWENTARSLRSALLDNHDGTTK